MSTTMNKRQRLLAAFSQQPVDRVPVGFWFHFPAEKGVGEACIEAHLAYYRSNHPDFMKIMCDGYFTYPLDFSIETPADWRKLQPLSENHPFIREQVERAKEVTRRIHAMDADCCTFYNIFAPFSSIRFKLGDQLVMDHLRKASRSRDGRIKQPSPNPTLCWRNSASPRQDAKGFITASRAAKWIGCRWRNIAVISPPATGLCWNR